MERRKPHPNLSLVSGFLRRHLMNGVDISPISPISPILDWAQRMSALGKGSGPQGVLAARLDLYAIRNKKTPEEIADNWDMAVDGPIAPVNIDPSARTDRTLAPEDLIGLIGVKELGVPEEMLPVLNDQAHPDRRVRKEELERQ